MISSSHADHGPATSAGALRWATLQVVDDRQRREHAPALGHEHEAAAGDDVGPAVVDAAAAEADGARR